MNRERYFLSLAMLLLILNAATAQDSLNYSTLAINIGVSNTLNKDQFHSPYTYKGTNFLFNSTYNNFRAKGMHMVDFTYSKGATKSIVSPKATKTSRDGPLAPFSPS